MQINNDDIIKHFQEKFPTQILNTESDFDTLSFTFSKDNIHEVIQWLKDDQEMKFHFLTDLCGVHNPDLKGKELHVVYHMQSMIENKRIRLKVYVPQSQASVPTVSDIYASANWMERETFDFFGIKFQGHPDLRRILNMDEMNYFPLLKQYPLEDGTRTDKNDTYFGR